MHILRQTQLASKDPALTTNTSNQPEIVDLRPSRVYYDHADLLAYGDGAAHPVAKETNCLELGMQQRLIDAAAVALDLGVPINALLTVRVTELLNGSDRPSTRGR